jgi:hypothetical protein
MDVIGGQYCTECPVSATGDRLDPDPLVFSIPQHLAVGYAIQRNAACHRVVMDPATVFGSRGNSEKLALDHCLLGNDGCARCNQNTIYARQVSNPRSPFLLS